MGGLSLWHWIIIIAVVALLFGGKGKISGLMGDLAKGIKAFKSGMKEEETAGSPPATPQVSPPAPIVVVERRSGHLLVSDNGRYAVLECRNGEVYSLRPDQRRAFPETSEGMRNAAGGDWTDEATARNRLDDATRRTEVLTSQG